jgi:methionine synthase II (cobalamin-independent)
LLAGVISTESSLLENQEKINNFLNNISNYFDLNKMIFTIDFIPYLLPRSIMDHKLKNMINILNKQELIKTN